MVDDALLKYIEKQRVIGYTDDQIKAALIKFKYNPEAIHQLFDNPTQELTNTPKNNFITKTTSLFSNQKRFFDLIKQESLKDTITYLTIIFSALFLILVATEIINSITYSTNPIVGIVTSFIIIILFSILFTLLSLLFAFIYKLLLQSFGYGSETVQNFKIIIYSLIPYILTLAFMRSDIYKWLLIVDISFGFLSLNPYLLFSFFLIAKGLQVTYSMDLKKALLFAYVPLAILFIVLAAIFAGNLSFHGWFWKA